MAKFKVKYTLTETYIHTVEVEADSKQEAISVVEASQIECPNGPVRSRIKFSATKVKEVANG